MTSPLERFISQVNNLGLAKTNSFNVEIFTPPCIQDVTGTRKMPSLLTLFCQNASFPATNIGVRDLKITGPTYKRPYSIDYGGEGIQLTFLVDRQMNIKSYFDLWMNKIINPFEFTAYYDEKETKYTTDIFIRQVTQTTPPPVGYENLEGVVDEDETYFVKLEDAFPRNIGLIELDTTAQNSVHKLTVNFAYRQVRFQGDIYQEGSWLLTESPQ